MGSLPGTSRVLIGGSREASTGLASERVESEQVGKVANSLPSLRGELKSGGKRPEREDFTAPLKKVGVAGDPSLEVAF